MSDYIYLLYTEEKTKNKTLYHFFNSTFVEHKIVWKQLFSWYRWYESIEIKKPTLIKRKDLEWTDIIHFNKLNIHIARLFALCMEKKWYKIQKVKIINLQ